MRTNLGIISSGVTTIADVDFDTFTGANVVLSNTEGKNLPWTSYGGAEFRKSGTATLSTGPKSFGYGDICYVDESAANFVMSGDVDLAGLGISRGFGLCFRIGSSGVNGYLAFVYRTSGGQRYLYVEKYVAGVYTGLYAGTVDLGSTGTVVISVYANGTTVTATAVVSGGPVDSYSFVDTAFNTNTRHGICGYNGNGSGGMGRWDWQSQTGSSYDSVISAESTLLYQWSLSSPTGLDELKSGRKLSKQDNGGGGPNRQVGALPNGESCYQMVGNHYSSANYFYRAGESDMTIQAGMVLEVVAKIVNPSGLISYMAFNYGSFIWQFGSNGLDLWARIHSLGGQRRTMTGYTLPSNQWFHLVMRVSSADAYGFNSAAFKLNGATAAWASADDSPGRGTPSGSVMSIGDSVNGDTGASTFLGKAAVYSSLSDARILAHAQVMGLAA